jgi:dTDP-4-dehydrorhamnose 3,5-epimerase
MSTAYHPASARGVRFDDPALGIVWPVPIEVVSEKDRRYPDFSTSLEAELRAAQVGQVGRVGQVG